MNKSTKISLLLLILLLSGIIIYVTVFRPDTAAETQRINAQQSALKEAAVFEPADTCDDKRTDAEHDASGATYTFTTNCLPTGWVAHEEESMTSDNETETNLPNSDKSSPGTPDDPNTSIRQAPQQPIVDGPKPVDEEDPREAALREAKNFIPKGNCITVMTTARHKASGAIYTFTSGCIPEGWEKIGNGDAI